MSPAAAAQPVRVPTCGGVDMIDAPIVVVDGNTVLVDGTPVSLDDLPAALKRKHEQYATYRHGPIAPIDDVIVYKMAPDTPTSVFLRVHAAGRDAGFATPAFMH